jgi:hypothetical protein
LGSLNRQSRSIGLGKRIKDFNFTFYSLQETIHDTIKWFAFTSKKVKLDKKIIGQLPPEPDWLEAAMVKN